MQFTDKVQYERFMLTPIAELEFYGLSIRMLNALEEHLAIMTLGDVLTTDPSVLRQIPNVGVSSVQVMHKAIIKYYTEEFYEPGSTIQASKKTGG